jgi:hypothetical protein
MSSLSVYLWAKAPASAQGIRFDQLLRQDVLDELNQLDEIKLIDLKIRASYLTELRRANRNLADALQTMVNLAEAQEVEVVLRRRRRGRGELAAWVPETLRRIMGRPRARQEIGRLLVKGRREGERKLKTVDMLRDQLVLTKTIETRGNRSRVLIPTEAFTAIREAFGELEGQLRDAAAIQEQEP